jgi:hypothetical protein
MLAATMAVTTFAASKAQAEMVSTASAIAKYQALADKERLLGELQSDEIRSEMIGMGIDPVEAEARLSAMTDQEIAARLEILENDPAGANDIIGALLTIFLILLITDLLCLTRVFKFVRTC